MSGNPVAPKTERSDFSPTCRHAMHPLSETLQQIENFSPRDGDWRPLDALLEELWASGDLRLDVLPVLFGVFERFPEDDGAGVLWSIVHGIEALPFDYVPALQQSHRRSPSLMSDIMLSRAANAQG